jgi:MoxR-like ATPase
MDAGMDEIACIAKDAINTFFRGEPGSGKTTTAHMIGAALGLPVYVITISKNTEEDTFYGMNKIVDGKISYVETEFVKGFAGGGIVILEEINLANPAVTTGALNQAIEFPYVLEKDGYIPVKRHPLCVIIGTFNKDTYGTTDQNQAFSSRYPRTYRLNAPKKEEFIEIIASTAECSKKVATWVYNAHLKCVEYIKQELGESARDILLNLTLRSCIAAADDIESGEEPKEVLLYTVAGKVEEMDVDLYSNLVRDVIDARPELY